MKALNFKPLLFVLFLCFAVVPLSGCLNGETASQPSISTAGSFAVVTYDTQTATLKARGDLQHAGATDATLVRFFTDAACSGTPAGQGTLKALAADGISVTVPSASPSSIYVNFVGFPECTAFAVYAAKYSPPPPPVMTSTSPASPSAISYTPAVLGSTFGVTAYVRLYDDARCTHLVGTGTTAEFSTNGIATQLAANTSSSLYAIAVEPFGTGSACTQIGTYVHSDGRIQSPTIANVQPTSPTNLSTQPFIWAQISANTQSVALFSDPGCSNRLANGTATQLTSSGLQFTVQPNTTTLVYAIAYDALGKSSACAYLTTYVHDTIAPNVPSFSSAQPASPTNRTIYPMLTGTSSADTAKIAIFNESTCTRQIGIDTKAAFESAGVRASLTPNATTTLYAEALDAAGNKSACVFFASYVHNTIPPDPPVFGSTTPVSPNNKSTTPLIFGGPAAGTVSLNFYQDETCTQSIGTGTADAFQTTGIQLSVTGNTITSVYAQPIDIEGNIGGCAAMTDYAHSTRPAAPPGFQLTLPSSPSNVTNKPMVVGTAAANVSTVDIFSDAACTNSLGHTSRALYVTNGIQVTLPPRARSDLYGLSTDVYGNTSPCTYLTSYIHDDVAPMDPVLISISPLSPTNQSTSPTLIGAEGIDPAKVLPVTTIGFYDSLLCLNSLGSGPTSDFTGSGLQAFVPGNAVTMIYGRASDQAGNVSNCSLMSTYVNDTWPPGKPNLLSANPGSPSYTRSTTLTGNLSSNKDLLPATAVNFYSDALCTSPLGSGPASAFTASGILLTLPENATTPIYAQTVDGVGNKSVCNFQLTFQHSDLGPTNLSASLNTDGSVSLNWNPDTIASPNPQYIIKRASTSGGPYTAISDPLNANTFVDRSLSNNATYYYVVAARNSTGTSFDSSEASATVTVGAPQAAATLVASPSDKQILLTWSGFASDVAFKVQRATQTGGPYSVLKTGIVGHSFLDKALSNGTTYYYIITATNPAGDSVQSAEANATPIAVGNAPTSLVMTAMNSGGPCADGSGIRLTWSSPAYYDGFFVRRGPTPGGETNLYNVPAGTNTFVECPSTWGGSYNPNFYTVAATWNGALSADSNEVAIVQQTAPTLVALGGSTKINLSWQADVNATSYAVYRATQSGGPYTLLDPGYVTNSFDDPVDGVHVLAGHAYFYYIQTNYPSGALGYPSFEQSATADANPTGPANLLVLMDVSRQPALFWSPPKNFNYFNIYRGPSPIGPWTFAGSTLKNANTQTFVDSPTAGLWYYQVTSVWGSYESAPVTSATAYRHGFPVTFTATPAGASISLSWSAVSGASSYKVYRSTTSGSGAVRTLIGSPTATTFVDATALAATGYFYTIIASFADGTLGERSIEVSAMRTGSDVPTGLTVTSTTSSSVTLTWSKISTATSYKIYKSSTINGTYTLVSTVSNTTATVAGGLLSGVTYYFKITSLAGASESNKSAAIAATPLDSPGAPSLSAGNNAIAVCWSAPVTGAQNYTIKRSTDGVSFTTVATGATSCPVNDPGVLNGHMYFYTITATFPSGATTVSPLSAPVTPGITPLRPHGLTVVQNVTGTDLVFNWSFIPGATAYQLYISTTSGSGYAPALVAPSTGNTGVAVSGLNPNTTYYFVVSALNGTNESATSEEVGVTTAAQPPAPTTIASGATAISVSWSGVPGAVAYDLQRSLDGSYFTTLPGGSGASSPYLDSSVAPGVTYFYRYLPYTDLARTIPMAPSAASSPGIAAGAGPNSPTELSADVLNSTTVQLNWSLVTNVVAYNVYRSTTGIAGSFTLLNAVATDVNFMPTQFVATESPGTTVFYAVTAVNSYGGESSFSNTVAVTLAQAPANLQAANSGNTIQLTWNAVGGASHYQLRRSTVSGGPYGVIASALNSTSFVDTNIVNGVTYYYVADSIAASGAISMDSSEASATGQVTMNLQVPIELTDQGMASDLIASTFERTRTSLDTSYYDGAVVYELEVNATNSDVAPRLVSLVDSSGTSLASVAIAAGILTPKRARVSFTPTSGADTYRLQLDATSSQSQLQVLSARVLVTQTGASRTRVYIPLLSSLNGVVSGDTTAPVESTAATAYAQLNSASLYTRDLSHLSRLADTNAWELETVVSAFNGAVGSVALFDQSLATWVLDTQAFVSNPAATLVNSPFAEGATNFSSNNDGEIYSVTVRCETGCDAGGVMLYKAGLWVTLSSLAQVELPYRIGFGAQSTFSTAVDVERTRIDLNLFSNPSASFQAEAVSGLNLLPASVDLVSVGTNDQDAVSPTPVAGATLNFNSNAKTLSRSPTGLNLNSGERYLPLITPATGNFILLDSWILIDASP